MPVMWRPPLWAAAVAAPEHSWTILLLLLPLPLVVPVLMLSHLTLTTLAPPWVWWLLVLLQWRW